MLLALIEKAPRVGAFLCLTFSLALSSSASADLCAPPSTTETVSVRHVYDGDTVQLRDGRRVRLLNIDTPELGRDGRPDQPYARAARDELRQLVQGAVLQLSQEQRKRDRYGRTLAHLYLPDGRNLAEVLLRRGLGFRASVASDLARTGCARRAEQQARTDRLALWARSPWRAASELQPGMSGFMLLSGRVTRVQPGRSSWWLELDDRLAVRISADIADQLGSAQLQAMAGQRVRVRGWVVDRRARGQTLKAGRKRWLLRLPAAVMLSQLR